MNNQIKQQENIELILKYLKLLEKYDYNNKVFIKDKNNKLIYHELVNRLSKDKNLDNLLFNYSYLCGYEKLGYYENLRGNVLNNEDCLIPYNKHIVLFYKELRKKVYKEIIKRVKELSKEELKSFSTKLFVKTKELELLRSYRNKEYNKFYNYKNKHIIKEYMKNNNLNEDDAATALFYEYIYYSREIFIFNESIKGLIHLDNNILKYKDNNKVLRK